MNFMQTLNNTIIRVFLLLFFWVAISCQSTAQKGVNDYFTISQIDIDKNRSDIEKEIDFNEENSIYSYKKYIKSKYSLQKNLEILLALNTGIDSLKYENYTLYIHTNFLEEPKEHLFYGFIADSYPSLYCKWNDVYKTLFDLKKIDNIIWFNNNEKATIFPSNEEWNQVHPPKFIMKKKWYFPDIDYSQIIKEDNSNVNKQYMIKDSAYLDSLLQSKPKLQGAPPNCF